MFGFKMYHTVVMDGTHKFVNNEIAGIIDMHTHRVIGKSRPRPMKGDPTKVVISRFTTAERYRQACRLIKEKYPADCAFNVTL